MKNIAFSGMMIFLAGSKRHNKFKSFAAQVGVGLGVMMWGTSSIQAAVALFWGSEVDAIALSSNGSSSWNASFTAELGIFSPGFVPVAVNNGEWAGAWHSAGVAVYSVTQQYFAGSTVLDDNVNFPVGAQTYIWVKGTSSTGVNEQLLVTRDAGNWVIPSAAGNSQTNPPGIYDLTCSGTGIQVIFGGVAGSGGTQTGGQWTTPAIANWCYQTHETSPLVPEPGSPLLLAIAGGIMGICRRGRPNGFRVG